MEHIAHCPCALGDVAFDGVGESVHTRRSREALGHGAHHIGIDDGDDGDIVHVDADHLAVLFRVRDDVVDGDFRRGACRRGNGDDGHALIFGGSDALERADIGEFGVGDDDADRLSGIHRGAAADGDDAVCTALLERFHARLHVLDRRVRLDLRIDLVSDARVFEDVGHLLGDAELQKVGVGADEALLKAPALDFRRDLLDRALAVIARFIEYKTVCHNELISLSIISFSLAHLCDFVKGRGNLCGSRCRRDRRA